VKLRRIAVVALLIVVVGAGSLFVAWHNRGPSRPSITKAVGQFRTSSTEPVAPLPLVPRPGVYVYRGGGAESLTFMNTHQKQGPDEPGTVTVAPDGCWTFALQYNSFHSQTWNRCAHDGEIVETGGSTTQKFDFVAFKQSEHSVVVCVPSMIVADPSAVAGTQLRARCQGHSETTGTNITQDATITYEAPDSVLVGRVAVPAVHSHEVMQLSGDQQGSVTIDIWFARSNGLPLRDQHSINVVSPAPAPLNRVTYSEDGAWQVTSLQPRT
jgi:hypothetical protein